MRHGSQDIPVGTERVWNEKIEREEVQAFLRLKSVPRLGDRGIWSLVRTHGSGTAALMGSGAQTDLWVSDPSPSPVDAWRESGICLCPITSPAYPPDLLALTDPPPLLFLMGRKELLTRPGVAVVGCRKATEAGRRTAESLGRVLGRSGITVISGMAKGIDGAAHGGALDVGGDTVAVLGSGLEVVYPPTHRGLFREIAKEGLLVSEFLPTESALPHHFPRRNRILAALARAVVVVEAGKRSGALITVDHGLDLGREILAFPGSVECPQAEGTNALIRDGARILTSPEAILEELPQLTQGVAPSRKREEGGEAPPDLPTELGSLWRSLSSEPRRLDLLALEAELPPETAMAGLSTLELLGRARRCPGMRFCRE